MLILEGLSFWHWGVLALGLLLLELFAPAAFFVCLAAAAALVACLLLVVPFLAWQVQLFLFAVFSIVSVFVARRFFTRSKRNETENSG